MEAARDIDVLRAALGEPELRYFGASYGTQLGATYAELFPDRVGRMVLDGGVDPALDFRERSLGQAAGFETALRAYVSNCVEQSETCFLGADVESGLARIQQFLAEVDAEPLPTEGDRTLQVGNAFYGIVLPLYVRDYWILLSQALQAAFDGDGTALLRLSDFYTSRSADGSYEDNSAEAIYVIGCLDDPSSVPVDEIDEEFAAFEQASPTFGRVFAWGLNNCNGLSTRAAETIGAIDAEGAEPIVVVGTTRDPATPYAWSVGLAEQLESGVLITRDGDGHTGYNSRERLCRRCGRGVPPRRRRARGRAGLLRAGWLQERAATRYGSPGRTGQAEQGRAAGAEPAEPVVPEGDLAVPHHERCRSR